MVHINIFDILLSYDQLVFEERFKVTMIGSRLIV